MTSTTLPFLCEVTASTASVLCRLQVLRATTDELVAAGKLHDRLLATVDRSIERTTTLDGLTGRARRRAARGALRGLGKFRRRLASRAGRAIPQDVRTQLGEAAGGLIGDLKLLRTG